MLKQRRISKKYKKSERGMAIIEAIPALFMIALVFNFSLGFFGAVHSGILNSIASYNYTIETFRFKSNLMYFRPGSTPTHYVKVQNRVHGTIQDGSVDTVESRPDGQWPATLRGITYNLKSNQNGNSTFEFQSGKNQRQIADDGTVDREFKVAPPSGNVWSISSVYTPNANDTPVQTPRIWVKTVYGICLNAVCKYVNGE